jgi:plasmid stabilization system protein ParE
MDYKIFWTEEATRNLEEIIDYLYSRWTQREVDNFKVKLSRQIDLIGKTQNYFLYQHFNQD